MAKKKRQRISYVLPLASTPGGHRLGVNGLSFDQDRSILYTGGRDGVICAWNLDLDAEYKQQEEKSLPSVRNTAKFRQQVQAHTHWVNDLVLVKNNLAVVSASSDASVKLWRPHSADSSAAYTIGSHSDYIKCLSSPDRNSNWVASGGLDHRIKLWDLAGGGEKLEIDIKKADNNKTEKSSIYALKANRTMIASGGPESVVRIWDVNSGQSITKLVGHTDNIRDILISDDGDTLLTASSDQTIKVWSVTAGRCLHTLTMHNDSVWCMYSDDPTLSVFYSGDRSGLVAKTDTRRAMEIEEGVSVAVCQEHDGITRLALAGDSIWTATSSSSINRWNDVDTELEIETPPPSPRHERRQSAVSRSMHSASIPSSPSPASTTNGVRHKRIPHNAILRLSNTAIHPGRKQPERNYSVTHIRKASEAILDSNIVFITPIRGHPEETIEGQNGLTKHIMLNNKKRVLTIDTAGEVVLWDLLECIPIKAFGRRHLDEVIRDVNTQENVANWCTVDTKTGKLTVMLEENYCFDAELYADELNIKENIDFREDQRINLGKWILRNLFNTLLDEELRRDDIYRRTFRTGQSVSTPVQTPGPGGITRLGAPTKILLPDSSQTTPMVSPGTVLTPRANGRFVPATPGMAIGLATPGGADLGNGYSPLTRPITNSMVPPTIEEAVTPSQAMSPNTHPLSAQATSNTNDHSTDYFSSTRNAEQQENTLETANNPPTPAAEPASSTLSPVSPTDDKRKSLFGKKFQMNFPKKLGRSSTDAVKSPAATANASEEKAEDSDRSSEKDAGASVQIQDNFYGVIQKIRQSYQTHAEVQPNEPLPVGITPSLPVETPVLKPPPHTLIIIQEDDPESGGLTDLYRGEIAHLGREADTVEKVAPLWLGELLLRNQMPEKDTVKVSFVLHPFEDEHRLPPITSADGNARLNANRMLRAKKIIAYVAERIDPTPSAPTQIIQTNEDGTKTTVPASSQSPPMKPEEYLELICQGQKVDPNMTLGTLRIHVWRVGGDVVLYYRANGKKAIKLPHPADVATRDEGMGQVVTNA